jgi:hypothetical protein
MFFEGTVLLAQKLSSNRAGEISILYRILSEGAVLLAQKLSSNRAGEISIYFLRKQFYWLKIIFKQGG